MSEKKLNKGAMAAKENCGNGKVDRTQEEIDKELALDLSIWVSNLGDLQEELIDAVDSGKEKSIPRLEREILELKDKIRGGMNALSGATSETSKAYQTILNEARDILKKGSSPKKDAKPAEIFPKKKPKIKKLSGERLRKLTESIMSTPKAVPKIKIQKKPKIKKPKSLTPMSIYEDEETPLSEKVMILQGMMTEIIVVLKDLLEENPYDPEIFSRASSTWLAHIEVAIDTDNDFLLDIGRSISDTIDDIEEAEMNAEED